MFRLIPPPLHRVILRYAHRIRHRWRIMRGTPIAGVSAILRDHENRILLVRHSYGPRVWALPGGGIKSGEDAQDAVRREVLEEIGCAIHGLRSVGTFEEEISGSQHTAHIFAGIVDETPRPDGRELEEARFFPASSLPEPLGQLTRARLEFWRKAMRERP